MIITVRKFWIILLTISFINIVIHIFFSIYQNSVYQRKETPRKYKYGRPVIVDIPQNWKTLYDLIVCNKSVTPVVSEVDWKNKSNGSYINVSDFRIDYNFNSDMEKSFEKPCPLLAPDLGPVAEDKDIQSLFGIEEMNLRIQPGGIHIPVECTASQQVAIVVPIHETHPTIRQHIRSFLYYIHPFLIKQQVHYQVFVIVKPNATAPYKRGELYNIGYKEAQAYQVGGWDCIIFHDAHLVPLDTRNLYRCSHRPRRLIADFQKPFKFGGAVAMIPKHFSKVNGFSNEVWSNDGDYIDMYKRLLAANFTVEGNIAPVGNYTNFEYLRQENKEPEKSQTNPPYYLKDGLSSIRYNIKNNMRLKQFYTLIEVEVESPKQKIFSSSTSDKLFGSTQSEKYPLFTNN